MSFNDDSSHLKSLENFYDYENEVDENDEEEKVSSEIKDDYILLSIISNINDSVDDLSDLNSFLNNNEKLGFKNIINIISLSYKAFFRYNPSNITMNKYFCDINYIPLIKLEDNKILIHDGKGNGNYFNKDEIINLINNNQIFFPSEENDKNDIINNGYICKNHQKNNFKYCITCKEHICQEEQCLIDHKKHKKVGPYKNIKKILKTVQKKGL